MDHYSEFEIIPRLTTIYSNKVEYRGVGGGGGVPIWHARLKH